MGSHRIIWIRDPLQPRVTAPAGWQLQLLTPEQVAGGMSADADAIVLDFPMPDWPAAELMEAVQRSAPDLPILIRDAEATASYAVTMSRLGVTQFLPAVGDPFPAVAEILGEKPRPNADTDSFPWPRFLIGHSPQMRQITHIIKLVGDKRATVLITGETGTGKELAARALHLAGSRAAGPMIAVNCSALPETLLESELFGSVRGAYTGAWQSRPGRFEQAQGGTIFLDEIGELPLELQAKLLRVLQEREVQRLGGTETIKLDVRVIAATNTDLPEQIDRGKFREDLYYRLNVVPLRMPPLRERAGDVPLLAGHFIDKICRAEGIPLKGLAPEAERRLCEYSWPGNVRQLENSIESAVALSGSRPTLAPADFSMLPAPRPRPFAASAPLVPVPHGGLDYERTLADIEKSILDQALLMTRGNKKAAADLLRLKRTTLSAKVRSLAFG